MRRRSLSNRLVRWPLVVLGHFRLCRRTGMPFADSLGLAMSLACLTLEENMIALLFLVTALVLFVLAALGVASGRFSLMAAGLACLVASQLAVRLP
ncbi:hypothetical protein [Cupriavidus sp. AcVe19-6a]|uniref:hypothetical protein n=1 Tax=Cupriavidus sp. AcVe19-6a TaxID=2821358 RepID=UPI001AEA85FD|nr:hypothetical protein [Cupriavidus sp. AcVe19-6a]MBP0634892.1 hypothetical protein [Cupriavidus sp. AcVe19-6a]